MPAIGRNTGTDLTSLALQAHNARVGIGAPVARAAAEAAPPAERAPAVVLDPRTRALADAASDATTAERQGDARRAEARAMAFQRAVDADDGAFRRHLQVASIEQMIRKFDETGEVWHEDGAGGIRPYHVPLSDKAFPEGAAAYIDTLRGRLDDLRRHARGQEETAHQLWDSYRNWGRRDPPPPG